MITNLFGVWRGIEGHPIFRAAKTGAEVGAFVGKKLGEETARRIVQGGAASGPVFTQEYFQYEISAIRMGAQI